MVRRNTNQQADVIVSRSGAWMRAIVAAAITVWTFGATGAGAASVSEVRVGTHDDGHTRIVVELDSPAGYRLQAPLEGQKPELIVELDATSIERDVPSKSRVVKKVHVEPSGAGATVRISLATGDVAIKEMLLANPPRIVFDLKARGPIPKSDAVADAAAEVPEEPASAEKVAIAPPTPAKVEAPKSEPIAIAAAEPAVVAEKREPPIQLEAPPSTSTKPSLPSAAAPSEAKRDAMPPPPTAPQPELEPIAPESATAKPTLIPPIDREKSSAQQAPAATSIAAAAEARRNAIAAKAAQQTSSSESLVDLAMSPIGLAAIGGVVLLLAIVVMRRRRGAEDDDPLYTVMSADDAGAGVSMDAAYPVADEAETRTPVLANLGPYDTDAFEEASEPAVREYASGPRQLALGSAPAPSEPASGVLLGDDSDSIFAAEPEVVASAAPAIAQAFEPSRAVSQGAQISAEVERRVTELERRLEQLTEARERLERQVAAQTEELRVQRAAIARTQRVVRTIAKTEDMATEPVPRA
jgi:hypothetical protein